MKASAVFEDGHISVFDEKDESALTAACMREARARSTRCIDFKINWPKTVKHRVIAEVKHSHSGTDTNCGDCGRIGIYIRDSSSASGPSPFGVVRYYRCECGNEWSVVENAT
jgi:hypothetical protein